MEQISKKQESTRILIVDDVETNRYVLRNIIVDMGYQPVLAENGLQALKIVQRVPVSLILLDISMPEMDGYELCRLIKEDPEHRDIPIIFISAFDDPADIIEGFSIGGEDYITKPFISEVVKARVGVHLKFSLATQTLQEANRRLQISVTEQVRQIEAEKKRVLYVLANIATENAAYETEHMARLKNNCRVLAQAMQLSPLFEHLISDTFVDTIELAAPLCDIGNMGISMEILQKDSTLTIDETDVMRHHTTLGAKILDSIHGEGDYNDFIRMSSDIAHYHHENWDGTGYPCGLKGDEIPLSAQIVSIMSEYCALTEKRCYRGSYNREEALEIMEQEAGKRFNKDTFQICQKIARQLQ
ncbi:MAG: response regulator [Agathobacter sp.]|nr:response regulator [Agathobacter sp.]